MIKKTLDELLGLDKFNFTNEERNHCLSIWNHYGEGACIDKAEKFHIRKNENKTKKEK